MSSTLIMCISVSFSDSCYFLAVSNLIRVAFNFYLLFVDSGPVKIINISHIDENEVVIF